MEGSVPPVAAAQAAATGGVGELAGTTSQSEIATPCGDSGSPSSSAVVTPPAPWCESAPTVIVVPLGVSISMPSRAFWTSALSVLPASVIAASSSLTAT